VARVNKPWGWYDVIDIQDGAITKLLVINPGQRLSKQYHENRLEHLIPFKGEGGVDLGIKPIPDAPTRRCLLRVGSSVIVKPGHVHRIWCSKASKEPLMMVEVWIGKDLRESDIIRIEDDYGRISDDNNP